jgi:hypothetical protein
MPYYIYRIKPFSQFEKLFEFEAFKAASAHAKEMRSAQDSDAQGTIKIMFADNESQAEDLLSQVRTPGPRGDD